MMIDQDLPVDPNEKEPTPQEAEHERLLRQEQEYRRALAIEKRAKWFYDHNYDDTAESEQDRDDR